MKEVHWKSLITGLEGHGSPIQDESAEFAAQLDNRIYTSIFHWTVRVFEAKV